MENKEEKKEEKTKCGTCTRYCDGPTLTECDECGEVHCKNCEYED